MKIKILLVAALLYMWMAAGAGAGTIADHSGNFTHDDDVLTIPITLSAPGPLNVRTLSYAGGLAANGQTVPRGGFDPVLSLFDSTNLLIALNDNGPTVPADTAGTGFAWDAQLGFLQLPAGNYLLALTQADNFPNGPFFSDGFARAGEGNFTGADQGQPGASFLDISGDQRTSAWALEISGNLSVDESAAPEPSAALLVMGGAALLVIVRKRRRAGLLPVLALAAFAMRDARAVSVSVAADTTLRQSQPDQNFGALPQLTVDSGNSALLAFDIGSAVPQNATITDIKDARLVLYTSRTLQPGRIRVVGICSPWSETTATYNTPRSLCSSPTEADLGGSSSFVIVDVTKTVMQWFKPNGEQLTGILVTSVGGSAIFDSRENTATSQSARLEITLTGPRGPQGPLGLAGISGAPGPVGPSTLPASSCGIGLVAGIKADGTVSCVCPSAPFIPTVSATVSGTFNTQNWPGGQLTLGSGPCTMTVNRPSGRIDATSSHSPWSIANTGSYSDCRIIGRMPDCNTVAGAPRLIDGDLFPACSSALGSTASTAHAVVICMN